MRKRGITKREEEMQIKAEAVKEGAVRGCREHSKKKR